MNTTEIKNLETSSFNIQNLESKNMESSSV